MTLTARIDALFLAIGDLSERMEAVGISLALSDEAEELAA